MTEIKVNLQEQTGKLKPINGLCNGPVYQLGVKNFTDRFLDLGVPSVRPPAVWIRPPALSA